MKRCPVVAATTLGELPAKIVPGPKVIEPPAVISIDCPLTAVPFGSKQWPTLITPGPGPTSLADVQ